MIQPSAKPINHSIQSRDAGLCQQNRVKEVDEEDKSMPLTSSRCNLQLCQGTLHLTIKDPLQTSFFFLIKKSRIWIYQFLWLSTIQTMFPTSSKSILSVSLGKSEMKAIGLYLVPGAKEVPSFPLTQLPFSLPVPTFIHSKYTCACLCTPGCVF